MQNTLYKIVGGWETRKTNINFEGSGGGGKKSKSCDSTTDVSRGATRPKVLSSVVCSQRVLARDMKPSFSKIYEAEKVSKPIRLPSQMVGDSPLVENKN